MVMQERKLDEMSVEGDWLVLADKSGSMSAAIEAARLVAGTLSRLGKGRVSLIFFDNSPYLYDATGKTYEAILEETKRVVAAGYTSIGCGLLMAISKGLPMDGIVVVSDGGENCPPYFNDQYKALVQSLGKEPPVYFFQLGTGDNFTERMKNAGFALNTIDLRGKTVDRYSVPGLCQTMRTTHYGLLETIMDTPILKLDDVLKPLKVEAEAVV